MEFEKRNVRITNFGDFEIRTTLHSAFGSADAGTKLVVGLDNEVV